MSAASLSWIGAPMADPTPTEIDTGAKAIGSWRYIPDAGDGCPSMRMGSAVDLAEVVLRAVLPGHDARLRAEVAEDIARALLAHDQRYPRDWIGGSDGATRAAAIARAHTTGGDHERDD